MSLDAYKFREDGHSTHSFGPTFGAAAAAGSLVRVNERQATISAFLCGAAGVRDLVLDARRGARREGVRLRRHAGAQRRHRGDAWSRTGFSGVEDVFSGERNFFVALRPPANPEELVRGLGEAYEILRTNIKRWSVGSPIQAPLDSLAILIQEHGVKAEQVEKLTIRVAHRGTNTTDNRPMPDINMQHMCAVMLIDGTVTFKSSHDEKRLRDPKASGIQEKNRSSGRRRPDQGHAGAAGDRRDRACATDAPCGITRWQCAAPPRTR